MAETYAELQRTPANDPHWTAQRLALSDYDGQLSMYLTGLSIFASAVKTTGQVMTAVMSSVHVAEESVPALRLDDYLSSHGLGAKRLALKVDVQGAEEEVLAGAGDTIRQLTYLELELPLTQVYEGQLSLPTAITTVYDYGFEGCLVDRQSHGGEVRQQVPPNGHDLRLAGEGCVDYEGRSLMWVLPGAGR